jgi:UTP--glucose-1-phosphate uridylyltransferase
MHVLTPAVLEILGRDRRFGGAGYVSADRLTGYHLSLALAELAQRERYLALERPWSRYDVGVKYGLLTAQLALALSGKDRDEVLAQLVELLAVREMQRVER